jgi:hypothetical protein
MDRPVSDPIDDSVLAVDAARPVSGKGVFQPFWLPCALSRSPHEFLDQGVDSTDDLLV